MSYSRLEMIMLVGVPGSGKSTWVNEFFKNKSVYERHMYRVLSTDSFIEHIALELGGTYDDVKDLAFKGAHKQLMQDISDGLDRADSFIWDQTNLTVKSRARKLQQIPKHYFKSAIVFPTPPRDILEQRLAARTGKTIRDLDRFLEDYTIPTLDEGFDKIEIVK